LAIAVCWPAHSAADIGPLSSSDRKVISSSRQARTHADVFDKTRPYISSSAPARPMTRAF